MKRNVLFFALTAFFSFFMVNAQAQSDFHSLFNANAEDAIEYIGGLVHPVQDVLDFEITKSTTSSIDIRIKFESLMRNYWEPYRINLRTYNGVAYPYSIEVTRRVSIYEHWFPIHKSAIRSVATWVGYCKGDDDDAIQALYGVSVSELSIGQKVAIMMMDYLYDE